jgi:predicted phage-related endonuclease
MTPALARDIDATKAAIAKIADKLATYPPEVQADLGAHLRAIAKAATETVDGVKDQPGLKHLLRKKAKPADAGLIVLGETFQAIFAPCTMNVLDQKALREEHPKIYGAFLKPITSERLNFAVRSR